MMLPLQSYVTDKNVEKTFASIQWLSRREFSNYLLMNIQRHQGRFVNVLSTLEKKISTGHNSNNIML